MLEIKSSVLIHSKYTPSVPQLHMANIADAQLNRTRNLASVQTVFVLLVSYSEYGTYCSSNQRRYSIKQINLLNKRLLT